MACFWREPTKVRQGILCFIRFVLIGFEETPNSVRVSSYAQYNTGLFILDTNRAPWGCGEYAFVCAR